MNYADGHTRVRSLKADGQIGLVPLVGVLDSGIKPVIRLWLADGRDVTLTHAHEVVTPEGKVRADSLLPGHIVLVDSWRGRPDHWGEHRQRSRETMRGTRLPDGRYMDKDGYILVWGTRRGPKRWMYEHRVVMEAMLGRDLHANHCKTDNRPANLRLVSRSEHATHHADRSHMPGAVPQSVTVLRVEDAGQQHVYDLSVDDDAHTWIGNGVIVGNTGKTAMTIAAIEALAEEFGEDFCGIVACAGGLKKQWYEQIRAFTCTDCAGAKTETNKADPHTHVGCPTVALVDGPPDKRMAIYDEVLSSPARYVILGYDQVIDDNNMVCKLPQMFVVGDEITAIKNPGALITQAWNATFDEAPFKYGLTGTPMENGRPEELFHVMNWIDPSVLGRAEIFDATFVERNKYGGARSYQNLPLFFEMMQDCTASIDPDDDDVAPYMPTMGRPRRILIELDAESARVYDLMSADLEEELAEAAKKARGGFSLEKHYAGGSQDAETQGRIMSKISCIRMLCAHPDQLIDSGAEFLRQAAIRDADPEAWPKVSKRLHNGETVKVPKPFDGSAYAAELLQSGELDELSETPKLDEVVHDARQVLAGECSCCADVADPARTNKLVLFSYHKMSLRVLEERFGPELASRYDGDMTLKVRNAAKERFQYDPSVRLFLTSDAGGYGVDLPQANHLFNLDKPFTAGRVTQRNARIRRSNLDYHDVVHVRDYLIWNSLEVYYADITAAKEAVVQAVRTGRGIANDGKIVVNAASLGAFLRSHTV